MMDRLLDLGVAVLLLPAALVIGVLTIIDDRKHPGREWDSHPYGGWTCPTGCRGCKKAR